MNEIHADARPIVRNLVLIGVFAYLVGGWMVVGGLFAPDIVPRARVPGWVLGLIGVLLLLTGWLVFYCGPGWSRGGSGVVRTVAPTTMPLKVHGRRRDR